MDPSSPAAVGGGTSLRDEDPDHLTPHHSFLADCLICRSNSVGKWGQDAASSLALLLGYPHRLLYSGVQKVEHSALLQEQLQGCVFCVECGNQLEQVRLIMAQLEELHSQIMQFQRQVCYRIHETLNAAGSDSVAAGLLPDVRRRVLRELNSHFFRGNEPNSSNVKASSSESPLSHCIVKLVRLEEQPSLQQKPPGFVSHISIKQEPEELEMEAEEVSLIFGSEPQDYPGDSSEEYILPTSTERMCEKRRRGRPMFARGLKRARKKQKNVDLIRSRLGRHRCQHPDCGFRAMRPSQRARHVLNSHFRGPDGVFLCPRCGAFFPAQLEELNKHLESHDGEEEKPRFSCPHCTASFSTFTNVRGHCRQKHPKKPPPVKSDYPHARQQLSVAQFPCAHCPSIFSQLNNLRSHCRRSHPGEALPTKVDFLNVVESLKETAKRFVCRHCSSAFSSLRYVRHHHQKHHPTEAEPTKKDFPLPKRPRHRRATPVAGAAPRACPHCAEVFPHITQTDFRKHLAVHTKPHKCAVAGCSAQFSSGLSLKFHCVRFHPELQVLPSSPCPHCPFVTNRPQTLRTHIRAKHETELTAACSVAGCSFRTPEASRLKQHVERVHEGQKKFLCPECGRGYYFQNKLTTHMRVHTGEKPFTCRFCGRGFTRKDKMQTHEATHGPARPFVCELCGFRFPTKNNLIGHRHSWHKNGLFRVGVQPTRKGKYNADSEPSSAQQPPPACPLSIL